MHPQIKFTHEDYLLFPEDGRRHELVDGEHLVTPAPSTRHQRISLKLALALGNHLSRAGAGELLAAPVDVVFSDLDVVQPDLIFISGTGTARVTESNVQGAPDLVVEIISPASRRLDVTVKRKLYERCGVGEYWIVDPELETVVVHRLGGDGYLRATELSREADDAIESPLLPGLRLRLADLFS